MSDTGEHGSSSDPLDRTIDALADEFVRRLRRGESPSISEFAERVPAAADRIRQLFPTLLLLEQATGDVLPPTAGNGEAAAGISMTPEPSIQRLGEYRILRELGRGGMGIVYEAEQESLGRRVALKVLPEDRLHSPDHLERFQREARAAAALQHPHIASVFGAGQDRGRQYLAMQLVDGQGLDRWIQGVRRSRDSSISHPGPPAGTGRASLSEDAEHFKSVARIGAEAAEALSCAHAQGIVHRDIKPSNILLDRSGSVWVTDFGLAKMEGSDDLTRTGNVVGTLRYMAPERFRGKSDPSSDIYGLGITLYESLTLEPAFGDRDREALLKSILEDDPPPPRRMDPRIPIDLETIILKATVKDPALRYPSATEMALDLRRFLAGMPVRARRASPAGRVLRACRRNPVAFGLGSAVVLLLALLLAGLSGMLRLEAKGSSGEGPAKAASRGRIPKTRRVDPPREAPAAEPQPSFSETDLFPVGEGAAGAWDLAAVDLNGDHFPDLVTVNPPTANVSVLLSDSRGGYSPAKVLPAGAKPVAAAILDLDLDGFLDVAVACFESQEIVVLGNTGKGDLEPRPAVKLEFHPFLLQAADLDGDGTPELAAAGQPGSLQVFRTTRGGTLTGMGTHKVPLNLFAIAAADLDGNGAMDLAVASKGAISLFRNGGKGSLTPGETIQIPGAVLALKAADLDGDRHIDLVMTDMGPDTITILHNSGKAVFETGESFPFGNHTSGLAAQDLDGDGLPELVVCSEESQSVSVIFKKKKDEPWAFRSFPVKGPAFRVVLADLDGNGSIDAATANGATISRLLDRRSGPKDKR